MKETLFDVLPRIDVIDERCVHCNHIGAVTVKTRIANGAYQVWRRCQRCGRNIVKRDLFLKHAGLDLDTIPLVADYTTGQPPCEVCEAEGTELHHWAPTHLFGAEAWRWPMCYLCRNCHQRWHDIVTPNMTEALREHE